LKIENFFGMSRKLIIILVFVLIGITVSLGYHFYFAKSSTAISRTGLVGYWTMDANDATSTPWTFYDRSGLNRNATSTGNPTFVAGKIKQAVSLDGSTQYFYATQSSISGNRDFTLSAWSKGGSGTQIITSFGIMVGNQLGAILLQTNYRCSLYGASVDTGIPPDANWHLLTFVYTSSNITQTCYVDGVARGTPLTNQTANITGTAVYIGQLNDGSYRFSGSVDDVRLYNRALSAQEVANLYNSVKTDYAQTPSRTASSTGRLVGWWTMDANDRAPTGNNIYDRSGLNNTASSSLRATSGVTKGVIKEGMDMTAANWIDAFINSPSTSTLSPTNAITVSVWAKPTANSLVDWATILGTMKDNGFLDGYMLFYIATGTSPNYSYYFALNSYGTYVAKSFTSADLGKWHHFVGTWDGKTMKLWVDGVWTGTSRAFAGPINYPASSKLAIGRAGNSGGYSFSGSVDDVRIYNYALTTSSVISLYNSTALNYAATPPRTGLVGYWTMDANDTSGTTYYDKSGFVNNATSTGSPTVAAGKINQGIALGGASLLDAGRQSVLTGLTNLTVSAWVKPNETGRGDYVGMWNNTGGTVGSKFVLLQGVNDSKFAFYVSSGAANSTSGASVTTLSLGRWYHVVGTYDGTNDKLYVNGVYENGSSPGYTLNTTNIQDLWIGNSVAAPTTYFDGLGAQVLVSVSHDTDGTTDALSRFHYWTDQTTEPSYRREDKMMERTEQYDYEGILLSELPGDGRLGAASWEGGRLAVGVTQISGRRAIRSIIRVAAYRQASTRPRWRSALRTRAAERGPAPRR